MVGAALAVLVGIAVVSTGHGGELAPSDAGPPAPELPPGRTLTPADLERVRFARGMWGYPAEQVEDVLDRAAQSLAERDARLADLERRLFTRQPGQRSQEDEPAGEEESW